MSDNLQENQLDIKQSSPAIQPKTDEPVQQGEQDQKASSQLPVESDPATEPSGQRLQVLRLRGGGGAEGTAFSLDESLALDSEDEDLTTSDDYSESSDMELLRPLLEMPPPRPVTRRPLAMLQPRARTPDPQTRKKAAAPRDHRRRASGPVK